MPVPHTAKHKWHSNPRCINRPWSKVASAQAKPQADPSNAGKHVRCALAKSYGMASFLIMHPPCGGHSLHHLRYGWLLPVSCRHPTQRQHHTRFVWLSMQQHTNACSRQGSHASLELDVVLLEWLKDGPCGHQTHREDTKVAGQELDGLAALRLHRAAAFKEYSQLLQGTNGRSRSHASRAQHLASGTHGRKADGQAARS